VGFVWDITRDVNLSVDAFDIQQKNIINTEACRRSSTATANRLRGARHPHRPDAQGHLARPARSSACSTSS
jgi:hypothetical protein